MKKLLSIVLSVTILFSVEVGIGINAKSDTLCTREQAVEIALGYQGNMYSVDNNNSYDCVDVALQYFRDVAGYYEIGQGNAAAYATTAVLPEGWTRAYTSQGYVPEPGDLAVWGAYTYMWNYQLNERGHIGVVVEADGDRITLVDQDSNTQRPAQKNNYRTSDVTCFIVPDFKCREHTWDDGVFTKEPTCKEDGEKKYTCTVCGETKTETISKSDKFHNYKVIATVKATLLVNGELGKECTVCKKIAKSTIYRPKTIELEKTVYTYNGKTHEPEVIIKDVKGKAISSKYYTVSYEGGKNVGAGTATVKFKKRYSGSKTLTFGVRPKGTSISKLTAGVKSCKVKWKKQTKQTTGYQIQYATNKKFKKAKTVTVSKNTATSKKITGLKANKKYYLRIRTYKKKNRSFYYYSKWSKTKQVIPSAPSEKLKTKKKTIRFYKTYKDNIIDRTLTYPKVLGSSTAAKRINKAFSSVIEEWNSDNQYYVNHYLYEEYTIPVMRDTVYTVTENTDKYISFRGKENSTRSGVGSFDDHYYSMTFDSKTGKRVTASSILGLPEDEVNIMVQEEFAQRFVDHPEDYATELEYYVEDIQKAEFNSSFYLKKGRIYFYSDIGVPRLGGIIERYVLVSFAY